MDRHHARGHQTPSGDALGTNDSISFGPAVSGQTITTTQGRIIDHLRREH